ncbi:MAG: hypothetical protein GY754_00250 [bacterium]|nr:hypothetical protein [bacterium]
MSKPKKIYLFLAVLLFPLAFYSCWPENCSLVEKNYEVVVELAGTSSAATVEYSIITRDRHNTPLDTIEKTEAVTLPWTFTRTITVPVSRLVSFRLKACDDSQENNSVSTRMYIDGREVSNDGPGSPGYVPYCSVEHVGLGNFCDLDSEAEEE